MDMDKANIKNITETNIESTKKMSDNAEIMPINMEQKKVIDKLEEVLNFLKSAQIKNEEDLVIIKKPLDDLQSSLKYIPTEPFFEMIPSEIKTNILDYLCDSNAFIAASVCQEWKEKLESRFTNKTVTIGERCCSDQCQDNDHYECLIPSIMLKASATHKMDVHLSISHPVTEVSISHPVTEVDSEIVTGALTSVSKFSLTGDCTCYENNDYDESFESNSTEDPCEVNPLSFDQLQHLFKGLEKKSKTMEKVRLVRLDLNELNQDRLVHCFVNKIKNLTLIEARRHGKMFSVKTLINKLKNQPNLNFKKLTLDILDYPAESAVELANALCNVKHVKLGENIPHRSESVTQLVQNILTDTRLVLIKTLIVKRSIDFCTLIHPEDLKKLLNKMASLRLQGTFTLFQVEAARSIPDVKVLEIGFTTFIQKGFNVF